MVNNMMQVRILQLQDLVDPVDQFHVWGGVTMAVELGAVSADHLDVTGSAEIDIGYTMQANQIEPYE